MNIIVKSLYRNLLNSTVIILGMFFILASDDVIPPSITINGDNPAFIMLGSKYSEAGASAHDVIDGKIIVVTTGTVDTAKNGRYTINYTATNTGGNSTTLKRIVEVSERGKLVSAVKLASLTVAQIQNKINMSLVRGFLSAKYPVDNYKIIYKTMTPDNKIINASGLLSIPKKARQRQSPVVAYHHGTILKNSDAPSFNFNASAPESLPASLGYIMVSPDYIGYGESSNHPHPYSHAKTLSSASVDLLRATKKWLADNNVKTNQQLFVTGYSEGGYAAMATQKLLQESFTREFSVTASVLAAGAYNMSGTAALLTKVDTLAYPVSVAYIIKNIDTIYANGLVNDAVKADFTYIFDRYFDGTHSAGEINGLLGNDPDTWLKKSFLDSLADGSNENFLPPMQENDIYDWTPKAPTKLFHGEDDQIVPYSNAEKALSTMQANGAENIEIINCSTVLSGFTISPASHSKCAYPYFIYTIFHFNGLAQDL
ncbi:MAG: DUF5011 domain-containing protein [Cocleimonas sp.]|nr:DUF5011 domain-containing protein [Cocleimonas sp.]